MDSRRVPIETRRNIQNGEEHGANDLSAKEEINDSTNSCGSFSKEGHLMIFAESSISVPKSKYSDADSARLQTSQLETTPQRQPGATKKRKSKSHYEQSSEDDPKDSNILGCDADRSNFSSHIGDVRDQSLVRNRRPQRSKKRISEVVEATKIAADSVDGSTLTFPATGEGAVAASGKNTIVPNSIKQDHRKSKRGTTGGAREDNRSKDSLSLSAAGPADYHLDATSQEPGAAQPLCETLDASVHHRSSQPTASRRQQQRSKTSSNADRIVDSKIGGGSALAAASFVPKAAATEVDNSPHQDSNREPKVVPNRPQENSNKATKKVALDSDRGAHAKKGELHSLTSTYTCLICADEHVGHYSVGPCDHPVCSLCSLRLRTKSQDSCCAVCKQPMEFVIVYEAHEKGHETGHEKGIRPFASFGLLGIDSPAPGVDIDHTSSMMFVDCKQHYHELQKLRSIICPLKNCKERLPSEDALLKHLGEKHPNQTMCKLCLQFRPLFIPEHRIMTPAQLKKHMSDPPGAMTGAGGDKSGGHPLCLFCDEHFFDAYQLYLHMKQEHQTCHLCPAKYQHRFYCNMEQLAEHLREEHFLCETCDCSGAAMTIGIFSYSFRNHIDYSNHMRQVHGVTQGKQRSGIALGFRHGVDRGTVSGADTLMAADGGGGGGSSRGRGRGRGAAGGTGGGGARRMPYLDLDMSSANPNLSSQAQRGGGGRGRGTAAVGDGSTDTTSSARRGRGRPTTGDDGSINQSVVGDGDEDKKLTPEEKEERRRQLQHLYTTAAIATAPLVPANMRVAGRITGTGRFLRTAEEDALEAASEEAAARRMGYAGAFGSSTNGFMGEASFPSLPSSTSGKEGGAAAASSSLSGAAAMNTRSTRGNDQFPPPNGSSGGDSVKQGGGASSVKPHPLSLLHTSTQREKELAAKRAAEEEKLRAQKEEEQRKQRRNQQIAEALGLSTSSSTSGAGQEDSAGFNGISTGLLHQLDEQELKRPLYPPVLIKWAQNNRVELLKLEKRMSDLLADKKSNSVQLKPMGASVRSVVHALCRYYLFNSFEYDPDPKRYVSIVKTIDSCQPHVLLSTAASKPLIAVNAPSVRASHAPVLYLTLTNPTYGNQTAVAAASANVVLGLPSDLKSSGKGVDVPVVASGASTVAIGALTCADVVGRVRTAIRNYYASSHHHHRYRFHDDHVPQPVAVKYAGASAVAMYFKDVGTAARAFRALTYPSTSIDASATPAAAVAAAATTVPPAESPATTTTTAPATSTSTTAAGGGGGGGGGGGIPVVIPLQGFVGVGGVGLLGLFSVFPAFDPDSDQVRELEPPFAMIEAQAQAQAHAQAQADHHQYTANKEGFGSSVGVDSFGFGDEQRQIADRWRAMMGGRDCTSTSGAGPGYSSSVGGATASAGNHETKLKMKELAEALKGDWDELLSDDDDNNSKEKTVKSNVEVGTGTGGDVCTEVQGNEHACPSEPGNESVASSSDLGETIVIGKNIVKVGTEEGATACRGPSASGADVVGTDTSCDEYVVLSLSDERLKSTDTADGSPTTATNAPAIETKKPGGGGGGGGGGEGISFGGNSQGYRRLVLQPRSSDLPPPLPPLPPPPPLTQPSKSTTATASNITSNKSNQKKTTSGSGGQKKKVPSEKGISGPVNAFLALGSDTDSDNESDEEGSVEASKQHSQQDGAVAADDANRNDRLNSCQQTSKDDIYVGVVHDYMTDDELLQTRDGCDGDVGQSIITNDNAVDESREVLYGSWECGVCTLINYPDVHTTQTAYFCSACASPRSGVVIPEGIAYTDTAETEGENNLTVDRDWSIVS